MDQFHQLLNNLNQSKPARSQSTKTPNQKSIPPRQFPKNQYRQSTIKLWLIIIGIIIVVALIGFGVGKAVHFSSHQSHNYPRKRVSRPVHHVHHRRAKEIKRPVHHPHKLSPKQGEKLLGHQLIKLNYAPIQSQRILNIYQRSSTYEENSISQRLISIINNRQLTNLQKQSDIKQYLRQKFSSTK